MKARRMGIFSTVMLVFWALLSNVWGVERKPATLAELAAYTGADREQVLLAGAKAEGKVVWYTTLTGGPDQAIPKAFEAKYPGVKVETYRGTARDVMAKIAAETQAKRFLLDTLEGTLPILKAMRDESLLMPYTAPKIARLPSIAKERAEKGLFSWATVRESYVSLSYNKNVIPAAAVPKSFDDLLNPALKGKLAFTTSDTGSRVIGTMLKFKGEDYLKKLKNQDISLHAVSARALLDMVVSGEVGASPTTFRAQAIVSMGKGAPISWVPMEVVTTSMGGVAISSRAPHPHGSVLFLDFILSPECEKILEKYGLDGPAENPGFNRWYPEEGLNTDQYEEASMNWDKALRQLSRRK